MGNKFTYGFKNKNIFFSITLSEGVKESQYREKRGEYLFSRYWYNDRSQGSYIDFQTLRLGTHHITKKDDWSFSFHDKCLETKPYAIRNCDGAIVVENGKEFVLDTEEIDKKESERIKATQVLDMLIENNREIYEAIKDKAEFCDEMINFIILYLEEGAEKCLEEEFSNCFEAFLKSEQEMQDFIMSLTYEQIITDCSRIKQYELPEEELKKVVIGAIKFLIEGEYWGATIADYKEIIYSDIEEMVNQYKENKEREYLRKKFPVEKILTIFALKIEKSDRPKELKELIEREMEHVLSFGKASEEYLLHSIERCVSRFLEEEKKQKEIEFFCKFWGVSEKIIDITPEKEKEFESVEQGENNDVIILQEYEMYQKLLTEYKGFAYRKDGKGLKPSFIAIPAFFDLFDNLIKISLKANIINKDYSFRDFDGIEVFKKELKSI